MRERSGGPSGQSIGQARREHLAEVEASFAATTRFHPQLAAYGSKLAGTRESGERHPIEHRQGGVTTALGQINLGA